MYHQLIHLGGLLLHTQQGTRRNSSASCCGPVVFHPIRRLNHLREPFQYSDSILLVNQMECPRTNYCAISPENDTNLLSQPVLGLNHWICSAWTNKTSSTNEREIFITC